MEPSNSYLPARSSYVPTVRDNAAVPEVVTKTSEYVWAVHSESKTHLAKLDVDLSSLRRRDKILFGCFLTAFGLSLAAGGAGVWLALFFSLKVGVASGVSGLIPGGAGAFLRRWRKEERPRLVEAERKYEGESALIETGEIIAALPPGPEKDKALSAYAHKAITRIPGK